MKSDNFASSILVIALTFLLAGCKTSETASGNAAKPTSSAQATAENSDNSNRTAQVEAGNDNASATKSDASAADGKGDASPELVGTYEAREIHDKGIITLVSKIKTVISFTPQGTYSRVSKVGGQMYHSDTGQFRIEKPDKLVLTIQFSREKAVPKIQTPPLKKIHTFSLSPDGDELKLTSEKGAVAVYRRIAKPKTS